MTRLTWDTPGERFYETGVDRGVLFVNDQGVAWSGLVSVADSPSGGEARPFYIDGFKYLNLSAAEEFEANLSAFSAPVEFGPCDGSVSLYNGLIATQQPRKSFGLSYRTKIGNDTDGQDHGYKIHIVYNALAAPSSRSNQTINNSPTPIILSWAITTFPPKISGLRPTAHFVIDSRATPNDVLEHVEDIFYGTDTETPRLPSIQELLSIFAIGSVVEAGRFTDLSSKTYDAETFTSIDTDILDGGSLG